MTARFRNSLLCAVLLLAPAVSLADGPSQKRIVADFEDVGTWRMIASHGTPPEAWFAGGTYLGGSDLETDHDRYVGEAKFAFDASLPGPYWTTFRRVKMTLVSGFLDGIEFDADSKGLPVSIQFVLVDGAGKRFKTEPAPLSGGWRPYRVDLNERSVPGLKECRFPAHLEEIMLVSAQPCSGSVFLDDIALTGDFARKDQVSIFPLSDGLACAPGQPIALRYRLRNARANPFPVTTRVTVSDFEGRQVFAGERQDIIPSFRQATAEFSLPPLPIGPYAAEVTVEAGSARIAYNDSFGVFIPNGRRENRKPMWFGICDFNNWHGDGENALHVGWMKQLGIDLVRIEVYPWSIEPQSGIFSSGSWKPILNRLTAAGIDILFLCTGTPTWSQSAHVDSHGVPEDAEAYTRYVSDFGKFIQQIPAVRYVEFWNEPDAGVRPDAGFFHGDLKSYLQTFHLFSQAIRATAPRVKITGAGLCVFHPQERPGFAEGVIKQGAPDYDVAAFHAHGPLDNYVERQEAVERWLREAGVDKPICNTETGERSGYDPMGRAVQAVTLVKKITYAKSRPRSEFYTWFSLKDYWDMDPKTDDSFGLVTSDNRVKPAFLAYNTLIHELANTSPQGEASLDGRINAYVFRHDDGSTTYVCWPKAGTSSALVWLKGASNLVRTGMFGVSAPLPSHAGLTPVSIGSEPIYLTVPAGAPALAAARPGEGFLDIDNGLQNEPGKSVFFAVRAQNPDSAATKEELALEDGTGRVLWTQALSLESGKRTACQVPLADLPPGSSDLTGHRYVLALRFDGSEQPFRFPLDLIMPYPIARAPGNPMTPALGDFVRSLPVIALKRREDVFELAFDPMIPPWRDSDDLSVRASVCHDDLGLYFHFDVTDDKQVPALAPETLWKGDSVQIAVAAPDQRDYTVIGLGLLPGGPVAWCSDNPDKTLLGRWDVPLKIDRKGTATTYDVYLPFSKLGFSNTEKEGRVRFSFLVNEDDGQGRVRWMYWHDGIGKGRSLDLLGHGVMEGGK